MSELSTPLGIINNWIWNMLEKTQSPKNLHRVLGNLRSHMACSAGAVWGLPGWCPSHLLFWDCLSEIPSSLHLTAVWDSPGWPGWLHRQYCVSFTPWRLILPRTWISVAFLSLCDRGSRGPGLVLGASKEKGFGYLATHLSPVVFENSPRQIWWPGQV